MKRKNNTKIDTAKKILAEGATLESTNVKLKELFGSGMSNTDLNDLQRLIVTKPTDTNTKYEELLRQFYTVFFKIGEIVQDRQFKEEDFRQLLTVEMNSKLLLEIKGQLKIQR